VGVAGKRVEYGFGVWTVGRLKERSIGKVVCFQVIKKIYRKTLTEDSHGKMMSIVSGYKKIAKNSNQRLSRKDDKYFVRLLKKSKNSNQRLSRKDDEYFVRLLKKSKNSNQRLSRKDVEYFIRLLKEKISKNCNQRSFRSKPRL
jgi:hypothetical protein